MLSIVCFVCLFDAFVLCLCCVDAWCWLCVMFVSCVLLVRCLLHCVSCLFCLSYVLFCLMCMLLRACLRLFVVIVLVVL